MVLDTTPAEDKQASTGALVVVSTVNEAVILALADRIAVPLARRSPAEDTAEVMALTASSMAGTVPVIASALGDTVDTEANTRVVPSADVGTVIKHSAAGVADSVIRGMDRWLAGVKATAADSAIKVTRAADKVIMDSAVAAISAAAGAMRPASTVGMRGGISPTSIT